jgi:hypothetical protein
VTDTKVVEVRAHTKVIGKAESVQKTIAEFALAPDKWPERALILDCETTTDQSQALLFGCFVYCRLQNGKYTPVLEGTFYANDLDSGSIAIVKDYCRAQDLRPPLTRKQFIRQIFLRAIRAEALIVGFNLFFDLSHIAADVCWSNRNGGGWSFTMNHFQDKDGELHEDQYAPRLVIKPKDGKGAFYKLTKVAPPSEKRPRASRQYPPIRCLDLKTLIWALDNKSHSLDSACAAKGVEGKVVGYTPSGRVSAEEISYNQHDIRATLALLNVLLAEFDRHPIDLNPERAYSPASIAKAYLESMGIIPPQEKFAIPPELLGIAMQAYFGGRAECRIRNTMVPTVHTDVRSEYPTVNTLLNLWTFLTADRLRFEDATEDARQLIANLTFDETFDPAFWKTLAFFALVRPSAEILPVRAKYNGETNNIGIDPFTSETPMWFAGPDLIAARLLTGRSPEILRAIRVVPEGQQPGLKKTALRGMIDIDPRTDDFFKLVIEARERVRKDPSLTPIEREALQYFLKILANAGSYGLFVELNPERVGTDPKTGGPARVKLQVFSGERQFETTSTIIERPGEWYCPVFASLITSGGRLLLAMLERAVKDCGGTYLLCDTDSMAIVASESGRLVPCIGGPYRVDDGRDAIKALTWDVVRRIVGRFEQLNPYDRSFGPASIIKIEDVNFQEGQQRQLFGYAIAAKRYAFFTRTSDGNIRVVKASAHGLGFLYPPKRGQTGDTPSWVVEAWEWILRKVLGTPTVEPVFFNLPAMMRFAISTPEVLKVLQARQKGLPYRDRAKPSNFVLSPVIDPLGGYPVGVDPKAFTLIGSFTSNPLLWHEMKWINLHDGQTYQLGKPGLRLPFQAEARTYGDVIREYRKHPEAKSLAPDGSKCTAHTAGLLRRTPIMAEREFATIGKETNRRWEREDDISLLENDTIEYRPNETENLVTSIDLQWELQNRKFPIRTIAKFARVSPATVKAAKRGRRIRKSTATLLTQALRDLFHLSRS